MRDRLLIHSLTLAGLLLVGATGSAGAADYYVKNGGNDSLDGLSLASAWATLAHAAGVVNPGDTVHVQNGSYTGFDLRRGGAPGQPVTFVAEGASVQITADGPTTDGINIEGVSHVVIDGFTVNGRTRNGIRAATGSFITVRNCHCGYNGERGIFTGFVDDFTAERNETHHSVDEHGIYVSNSGDRPIIRYNVSYSNRAAGIHMNGDASLGGDGLISNAVVEGNILYDNGAGGGSAINMDGVTGSVVRNNLIYDNHASGISLFRIDGAAGSSGNLVINNTIINGTSGNGSDGRWAININNGSTANRLLNNILYNHHSFRGVISIDSSSRPGFVSNYNSLMSRFSTDGGDSVIGFAAWQALGYDASSFLATPADHFLAPGSNFHLLNTSPAIDSGTSTDAPARDLDGSPRPVGAGYDIGAYEAQLLECGDGGIDAGEQCGEPGLGPCADPCTSCQQCICAENEPVCGDSLICASEVCESDGDCAPGEVCQGCQCVNAPACTSGIGISRAALRMRADAFLVRFKGDAVIPKPWSGIDPPVNGVRVVIDAARGGGGIDVTIPGGTAWRANGAGTRWTYTDPTGAAGGITRVVVKDRSSVQDGLVRWRVIGKVGTATLPDVGSVRSAIVLGSASECAALDWNPPAGPSPACTGDTAVIVCR